MPSQSPLTALRAPAAVAIFCLVAISTLLAHADQQPQQVVRNGKASIGVTVRGSGAALIFIPSLGRSVHDFDDLARRLSQSGYRTILPEVRGIGSSSGPLEGITLHDLASDTAAVIQALGRGPVIVVGHAFGNQVARMVATDRPALVKQVILLAAGGLVPRTKQVQDEFLKVFDPRISEPERIAAIGATFFARGQVPKSWQQGWHLDLAKAQMAAQRATSLDEWWAGGSAPMVVLQGTEDRIAVPENSERLAKQFPDRVRVIQIPRSGHAMLPEQPELIASVILKSVR